MLFSFFFKSNRKYRSNSFLYPLWGKNLRANFYDKVSLGASLDGPASDFVSIVDPKLKPASTFFSAGIELEPTSLELDSGIELESTSLELDNGINLKSVDFLPEPQSVSAGNENNVTLESSTQISGINALTTPFKIQPETGTPRAN